MKDNRKIEAMKYLEDKYVSHIDMIEIINRGTAKIIAVESDGLLILDNNSGLYILSSESIKTGSKLIELIVDPKLIAVHQRFLIELLVDRFKLKHTMSTFQNVWTEKEIPMIYVENIRTKILDINYENEISSLYSHTIEKNYIYGRLKNNEMIGAFYNNALVGFIGLHEEGSMGMLEIKEAYRNKGIASLLISELIKFQIDRGRIPFSQFELDNISSRNLHMKMGFKISEGLIYWLELEE